MRTANLQDQNELIRASNRPRGRFQIFSGQTGESSGGMGGGEDNHQRFARLVLPHLGDAYSLARWITANRTDAEDIVQEASLRAFRAIASVAEGNSRAWLLTIVRNTAYSDVQGLGYREISQVTGVPIGTVMSRLARGRARVIKTIGGKSL